MDGNEAQCGRARHGAEWTGTAGREMNPLGLLDGLRSRVEPGRPGTLMPELAGGMNRVGAPCAEASAKLRARSLPGRSEAWSTAEGLRTALDQNASSGAGESRHAAGNGVATPLLRRGRASRACRVELASDAGYLARYLGQSL